MTFEKMIVTEAQKKELMEAYSKTTYRVVLGDNESIDIKINIKNPALWNRLYKLYQEKEFTSLTFITAQNPKSKLQSQTSNDQLNQKLQEDLDKLDVFYLKGQGMDLEGNWPPEESFAVLDLGLKNAVELAKKFDQNAIVYYSKKTFPQLIWCE